MKDRISWINRRNRINNNNDLANCISKSVVETLKSEKLFKKTKIESITNFLAGWSQVIMVLVLIFGYIYTVIPIYEKDKISEELALLEIEKTNWEKRLNKINNEIIIKKNLAVNLKNEISNLEFAYSKLKERNLESEKRLGNLVNKLTKSQQVLNESKKALKSSEQLLYIQHKKAFLGENLLPLSTTHFLKFNTSIHDAYNNVYNFSEVLKKSYVQPITIANQQLVDLEEKFNLINNEVSKNTYSKFIEEYKSGLNKYSYTLQCPEPDFSAWEYAYNEALLLDFTEIFDSRINTCVEENFKSRVVDEKWTKKQIRKLKKDGFWEEQTRIYFNGCKELHKQSTSLVKYYIEMLFTKKWTYIIGPCDERLSELNEIIFQTKNINTLLPFRDMSPPNINYIKSKVIEKLTKTKSLVND